MQCNAMQIMKKKYYDNNYLINTYDDMRTKMKTSNEKKYRWNLDS